MNFEGQNHSFLILFFVSSTPIETPRFVFRVEDCDALLEGAAQMAMKLAAVPW